MPGPLFLDGERVALHVVAEADHGFLQRWRNHPDVRRGFGATTVMDASTTADRVAAFADADDREMFVVAADGDPVGEAFLFDLDEQRGRVEVGYWIAPDHRGNGYATETLRLLAAYAFDQRRLHRVVARVLAFNDGSRRVVEKVGFRHEGRLRDAFYVDGEYVDADVYGLLEAEWGDRD